jgi:hypothetical protein
MTADFIEGVLQSRVSDLLRVCVLFSLFLYAHLTALVFVVLFTFEMDI